MWIVESIAAFDSNDSSNSALRLFCGDMKIPNHDFYWEMTSAYPSAG
jgi:hypothetical protein